jgi:hypothetical protein
MRHPHIEIERLPTRAPQLELEDSHVASLDELGEIVQGDLYLGHVADIDFDIHPPVRWGKGYKGTAASQFPHPNMYSIQDTRIPLDQLTVRHLTQIFSAPKRRLPSALEAWRNRIGLH